MCKILLGRPIRMVLCCLMLLYSLSTVTVQAEEHVPDMLNKIIVGNWQIWNGRTETMSSEQRQKALQNMAVRGDSAAVLAAVSEYALQHNVNEVTRFQIAEWIDNDRELQYTCLRYMLAARNEPRKVFQGGRPDFSALTDRPLGNRAIVSAMGWLAVNQPERIKGAWHGSGEQNSWKFPSGVRTTGLLPSEGDILRHPLTHSSWNGIWPILLYDSFVKTTGLSAEAWQVQKSWYGVEPLVLSLQQADREQVRSLLRAAEGKTMVQAVLGEAGNERIPGLSYLQTYAILHFDSSSDTVMLWNPSANSFEPLQAVENQQNGYLTTVGVFAMPLTVFHNTFSQLVIANNK